MGEDSHTELGPPRVILSNNEFYKGRDHIIVTTEHIIVTPHHSVRESHPFSLLRVIPNQIEFRVQSSLSTGNFEA